MTIKSHTSGPNMDTVLGRLEYAASKAGSIGLGEYTRVHKKDLSTLIESYKQIVTDGLPVVRIDVDIKDLL